MGTGCHCQFDGGDELSDGAGAAHGWAVRVMQARSLTLLSASGRACRNSGRVANLVRCRTLWLLFSHPLGFTHRMAPKRPRPAARPVTAVMLILAKRSRSARSPSAPGTVIAVHQQAHFRPLNFQLLRLRDILECSEIFRHHIHLCATTPRKGMHGQHIHSGLTQWSKRAGQCPGFIRNLHLVILSSSNQISHHTLLSPPK